MFSWNQLVQNVSWVPLNTNRKGANVRESYHYIYLLIPQISRLSFMVAHAILGVLKYKPRLPCLSRQMTPPWPSATSASISITAARAALSGVKPKSSPVNLFNPYSNQSINRSINKSIIKKENKQGNQIISQSANRSINLLIDPLLVLSINQSTNQSK